MAVVRRVHLVKLICKQAHISRREADREKGHFTKQELLKLHSYLTVTNDLQKTPGKASLQVLGRGKEREA